MGMKFMPRTPGIEYSGAFYHVMCRGNNGEYIVTEEKKEYIRYIMKYKERYEFKVYAYCIMDNHIRLLIETGEAPLSELMRGI